MPSFLDYQEKARKRTRLFVALHILCVAAIAFLVGALALATMWLVEGDGSDSIPRAFVDARLGPVAAVVGIVIAIVALATLYRTSQLRGGGGKVAESLGGRRVRADTHDRLERRLLHVVEEMAIASRVAIPSVYVLDEEPGINAFAAGWSPNDAAVAVTRGALESLSREELQCVVGHEFSHILNGDMRLNVRMLGSIFGLVCLSVVGRVLMRAGVEIPRSSRPRRSKDEGGVLGIALLLILVGLFVWLLGLLGVLFGRILQSTISRQREFLADASSVQFTRNPHGMASALETIGASARHGTVAAARAPEVAHMLFAASGAERLFASHPPLDARIRRFEPDFDGRFDRAAARLAARRRTGGTREEEDDDRDFPFRGRGGILGGEIGVPGGGVLGGAVLGEALRTPVILLFMWKNLGFSMIIFLAALQAIPESLYEYATLEGASFLRQTFSITLPMIVPSAFLVFILCWINAFRIFKEVYFIGGAYPEESLYTLQNYMNNMYGKLNYQNVTTAAYSFAVIVFALFGLLFFLQQRAQRGLN